MKFKFSTSVLAISLSLSSMSGFAGIEGPQNTLGVLKGQEALDNALGLISNCALAAQAQLEASVASGRGFRLTPGGGSTTLTGCNTIIGDMYVVNTNTLRVTINKSTSTPTPLQAQTFSFGAYADQQGSTPYSNQAVITSWDCSVVTGAGSSNPTNLFAMQILGQTVNVLANAPSPLNSCEQADAKAASGGGAIGGLVDRLALMWGQLFK